VGTVKKKYVVGQIKPFWGNKYIELPKKNVESVIQ